MEHLLIKNKEAKQLVSLGKKINEKNNNCKKPGCVRTIFC